MTLQEHSITTNKGHDERAHKTIVCSVRLAYTSIRQSIAIQPLHLTRLVEAQKGKAHDAEVDKLGRRYQADEPV